MENKEENFEDLLEQYLDEEEIQNKIKQEEKEIRENKNKFKKLNIPGEYTITIEEFLRDYLKMDTNHIKTNNLTHKGLKDLTQNNPLVIGIYNDYLDLDEIIKRDYLVVTDCYGNIGSYLNPNYLRDLTKKELIEKELKILEKVRIITLENLEEHYNKFMEASEEYKYLEVRCKNFYEMLTNVRKGKTIDKIEQYVEHFGTDLIEEKELEVKKNSLTKHVLEEKNIKF